MLPSALKQKLAAAAGNGKSATKPPPKTAPVAAKKRKSENSTSAAAAATESPQPKRKPKSKFAAAHRKPLTTDEINRLQESTNTLTNENLFQLQIAEILRASAIPTKYDAFIATWLADLNQFLGTIKSDTDKTASSALKPVAGGLPFDGAALQLPAYQFQFIRPTVPAVLIGSQSQATLVGPAVHVDVAIEMPAACFQKTDYMNAVYLQKRALYVHRLAAALRKWPQAGAEVSFEWFRGDRLRPVLLLTSRRDSGCKHLRIYVHLVAAPNSFKLNRFLPGTSNVRATLFGGEEAGSEGDEQQQQQLHPTPHYNAAILRDLTLQQNEQFVQRMLRPTEQQHVREAIVLFKLWLRTRGLERTAFGGAIVAAFAVLLIKQRRLHVTMSAYDVLRNLWIQLATSRWHEASGGASLAPQPAVAVEVFAAHFEVVFVDVSGYGNLCAQVPLDVYLRVREECQGALRFLAEASLASFRLLFAGRRPTWQQFDHVINITRSAQLHTIAASAAYRPQQHDYIGQTLPIATDLIANVLRHGLGKRVDSITPIWPAANASWRFGQRPPKPADRLSFGLILNAEFCTDVLDKGPQADQETEADAFRQFWGTRSEMRRFQDGSIVEACVWASPTAPLAIRRLICKQIALHLLQHHFQIAADQVLYVADQLDIANRLSNEKLPSNLVDTFKDSNSEHLALAAIKSFDDLGRQLRSLDNIPLGITALTGASPVFRYCELEPLIPVACVATDNAAIYQSYAVLDAVIELSASGRWPDNLQALRRLKAAFYLRIAAGLRDQHNLAARTDGHCIELIKDGYHYRLRIVLPKEQMLLKRQLTAKGVVTYRNSAESVAYERDMLRLPRLTILLHTLYHQHSSFGPATQIAKRWLRSQLIDGALFPDECTELLMAAVYTQTGSWQPPAQPQAAFVRWLQLMATSQWQHEMVVLNFGDALGEADLGRLEGRFRADRESFPLLCIVTPAATATVATVAAGGALDGEVDAGKQGAWTIWSAEAPAKEIVARVAVLAAHSLQLVEAVVWGGAEDEAEGLVRLEPKQLFVPSLEGYDVLIRLRRSKLQQSNLCEFVGTRRGRVVDEAAPAADFNVAQKFVAELREAYDEFAVFLCDPCGGDVVAVMWKPAVRVAREFAPTTIVGCHLPDGAEDNDDAAQYVCNLKQIVDDFRVIGHGLVETITEAEA